MLSARFLIPPTPETPLISAPVPMARKRVPPPPESCRGLGQPSPGQTPVERLIPFSCEFSGAADLIGQAESAVKYGPGCGESQVRETAAAQAGAGVVVEEHDRRRPNRE